MSHKIQNSNKETEIIKCRKELGVGASRKETRVYGTKFVGLEPALQWRKDTLKSHDEATRSI